MKLLIRILNTIVAICCIIIIILIFWFLYLTFSRSMDGVDAARYIASEVSKVWGTFSRWCTSLFA